MQDFKNIIAWKKSHLIVLEIYRITSLFPNNENYSLVQQMRRAAYSIPSNIAEGSCRSTDKDFTRFLYHSLGSANELDYFLLLAYDLSYIDKKEFSEMNVKINEIRKMLTAFIKKLQYK